MKRAPLRLTAQFEAREPPPGALHAWRRVWNRLLHRPDDGLSQHESAEDREATAGGGAVQSLSTRR